jgi:hypothetical protein
MFLLLVLFPIHTSFQTSSDQLVKGKTREKRWEKWKREKKKQCHANITNNFPVPAFSIT